MKSLRFLMTAMMLVALALQGASAAPQPYVIPLITDLTGANAFSGNDYADTARAFEHYFNEHGGIHGTPIHFDVRDSETSPQVAVQLTTQVLGQHPPIVLGPAQIGQCAAVVPLFGSAGPVDYCLSPGLTPKTGSYVFASSVALGFIQPAMLRYARLKGYRRLAMISSTDASGQLNEQAALDAVGRPENKSLSVVSAQHFNVTDPSVSAQIASMLAAKPDAVIIWANGTAFGTVLRNLKDAGADLPVFTSGANLNQRVMQQFASYVPQTMLFNGIVYYGRNNLSSGPLRTQIDDFYAAFKELKLTPTPSSGYAWDPCLIVGEALRKLGAGATGQQIHDYLTHLHGFVGISGVYDFRDDQHGLTDKSVIVVRYDQAKQTFVAASRGGGIPL